MLAWMFDVVPMAMLERAQNFLFCMDFLNSILDAVGLCASCVPWFSAVLTLRRKNDVRKRQHCNDVRAYVDVRDDVRTT